MHKNKRAIQFFQHALVFTIYLVITIVIFRHRVFLISTHYGLSGVDTDGTFWYYWARVFSDKSNTSFTLNSLISYPFGFDVSYVPFSSLIYEIHIYIIKLLGGGWQSILLVANVSTLLSYPLSAFSAYLLSYYLTKNKHASFLSGIVFSFSYYHILMGRGSLSTNHFEFIPLYFLFFLMYLDTKKITVALVSALLFSLLFWSNAYWGFFSLLFTPIIILTYKSMEPLKDRLRGALAYYILLGLFTLFTNLTFIYQQIYFMGSGVSGQVGRVINPSAELLNIVTLFSPSENGVIYPINTGSPFFLGYLPIFLCIWGAYFFKNNKIYRTFLLCFIFALLFTVSLGFFSFFHDVYFFMFGFFRAVSRLTVFMSLFLSLMSAFVFVKFSDIFKPNHFVLFVFTLTISGFALLEGITKDPTWQETTDFSVYEASYGPLRDDANVKVLVTYPFRYSNGKTGFPSTRQMLAQIVHQKRVVNGLSPFDFEASVFQSQILDINKYETIDILKSYGVDTLVVMPRHMSDASNIASLFKDPRLEFWYAYEHPTDAWLDTIVFRIVGVGPVLEPDINVVLLGNKGIFFQKIDIYLKLALFSVAIIAGLVFYVQSDPIQVRRQP